MSAATAHPAIKEAKKNESRRPLIGWREWASLPEFSVKRINAKIDTGAGVSAIHAFNVNEASVKGRAFAEFILHPVQHRRQPELFCRAPIVDRRIIRSSNGQEEERFAIETPLKLGDRVWKIHLTLTNRDEMEFRLLIGRDALRDKFLVDPSASYLA